MWLECVVSTLRLPATIPTKGARSSADYCRSVSVLQCVPPFRSLRCTVQHSVGFCLFSAPGLSSPPEVALLISVLRARMNVGKRYAQSSRGAHSRLAVMLPSGHCPAAILPRERAPIFGNRYVPSHHVVHPEFPGARKWTASLQGYLAHRKAPLLQEASV